jgi:hypothetical protein
MDDDGIGIFILFLIKRITKKMDLIRNLSMVGNDLLGSRFRFSVGALMGDLLTSKAESTD